MAKGKKMFQSNLQDGEWEKAPTALCDAAVSGLAKAVYFAILCDRDGSNFGTRHIAKRAGIAKSAAAKHLQELHDAKMIVWERPRARFTGSIMLLPVKEWKSLSGHHADSSGHHADSSGHHADSSGHHADVIQTTDFKLQTGDEGDDIPLSDKNSNFEKLNSVENRSPLDGVSEANIDSEIVSKSTSPHLQFTFEVAVAQLRGQRVRTADIDLMVASCKAAGISFGDMDGDYFIKTLWPESDGRRRKMKEQGRLKEWNDWKANAKADFGAAVAREYFDRPDVAPKQLNRTETDLDPFKCDSETFNQFFGELS